MKWPEVVSVARRWKSDPRCSYEYIYENGAFNRLVVTDLAESWDEFIEWSNRFQGWGFRGQRESSWTLQSSLERRIRVEGSYGNMSGHHHLDRKMVGEELLSGFRELAPLHLQDLPSNDDLTGWLALMQHYGGPTRLLDWTECPFVGMYFALWEEPKAGNHPAVWAIDLDWLKQKEQEMLGASVPTYDPTARIGYLNSLLEQSEKPLIVRIDPQLRNDRMVVQKGFFLWKLYRDTALRFDADRHDAQSRDCAITCYQKA